MSGDSGKWTKEVTYESEKIPIVEENPLENLDFEGLIKKIGFYQR
jgi:hypothetical protein